MNDENKKIEEEIDTDPGDEVVYEDNVEVTGADYTAKTNKLKERIKDLERKNTELLDGWQRDKADFINIRKREEEQRKEFITFAKEDLVTEFIPVLDSFESAMKNKETWSKVDQNWRVGVEYIHSQLLTVLTQNGLKVLNPLGETFNPERDEAIENIPVENHGEDDKILEVVQAGYSLHDKIIRPAKVKVGHLSQK